LPLIFLKSSLPAWLESGAEKAVGIVIVLLSLRVMIKWLRGDYSSSPHVHERRHRHLRHGSGSDHAHRQVRTPQQAFAIGILHGLAGTGAVVLLLIAALPSQIEAAAALALFAPMTVLSMIGCTSAFAWVLTRPLIEPIYRRVLIPSLGLFALAFGTWYAGIG
jgi:hypothetical protein